MFCFPQGYYIGKIENTYLTIPISFIILSLLSNWRAAYETKQTRRTLYQ